MMVTLNDCSYFCIVFGFLCLLTVVKSHKVPQELQSHPNWKLLDRNEDCGHSSSDRIIGGVQASLGQYPWIARLGYRVGVSSRPDQGGLLQYSCGGAIISDRYILTAAHCVPREQGLSLVQVRLGEYNASADIDCLNGVCAPPVQDIDIEQITCHDAYNTVSRLIHDICLLRLAKQIHFNRYVYPICLPAYKYFQLNNFTGKIMEVAGWGVTNIKTDETSDVLMTLKVPVVDHSICVSKFSEKVQIRSTQMCAGGVIGKDSCGGDSGGPLMSAVSMGAPPRYFIVGIVSFGLTLCANSDFPGIYTNVFQYMPWILDNVRE